MTTPITAAVAYLREALSALEDAEWNLCRVKREDSAMLVEQCKDASTTVSAVPSAVLAGGDP